MFLSLDESCLTYNVLLTKAKASSHIYEANESRECFVFVCRHKWSSSLPALYRRSSKSRSLSTMTARYSYLNTKTFSLSPSLSHTHTRFMKPVLYDCEVLLLSCTNKRTLSLSLPSMRTHTSTHTHTNKIFIQPVHSDRKIVLLKNKHVHSLSPSLFLSLSVTHASLARILSLLHTHAHERGV